MAYTLPRLAKALNAAGYSISVPETESMKFQLTPNPTTSNALISVFGATVVSVEVHDVLGRRIFRRDGINASEAELPSGSWSPGAYFIRVQTDRGMRTAKLIRH
jgi:hypothetical protein